MSAVNHRRFPKIGGKDQGRKGQEVENTYTAGGIDAGTDHYRADFLSCGGAVDPGRERPARMAMPFVANHWVPMSRLRVIARRTGVVARRVGFVLDAARFRAYLAAGFGVGWHRQYLASATPPKIDSHC